MANISPITANSTDWRDHLTWYTYETRFIRIIKWLGGLLFYPMATVECSGLAHIPATGPCVLASNHINNFDVIFLGLHLPRHPHFMAKIELYKNPLLAWAIRLGGSFPIHRGENDPWAIQQAGRVLEAGQMLCMFPEGTRSGPKAQLRRGKVGAVKLALEHHAFLVPTAILGTQNLRLGGRGTNRIKIQVGQPLDLVTLAGPPPYKYETLRELTGLLMQQIAAMLPPAHRGVYA
jgi:1-acyl-sn-glycerol-3-phosphate acyltransferase